jgi:redox-sensitive bicupin YhaK (pirin superfamily)
MTSIAAILKPHSRDLGGFSVRRLLPAAANRMIGPFIFFDHLGPAVLAAGTGMDVRPHPHIGLATVTYLFDGAIMHRDSLGNAQKIVPGDVNWMTAGRGIVHSERTPPAERAAGLTIHGIQTWVALPVADEDCEPSFSHHPASTLPHEQRDGVSLQVLAGAAFGLSSPVPTCSKTLYVAAHFSPGSTFTLPPEHAERGIYVARGDLVVDGAPLAEHHMAVLRAGTTVTLKSAAGAHVMVLGGDPVEGDRYIEWNFVSSSRDKIEHAKAQWRARTMASVPGETEWIPLPDK